MKIKIPWQGAVLGVFSVVGIIFTITATVLGSSAFLQAFVMSQNQKIAVAYLSSFPSIMVVSYLVIIIETLFVLGYFYGKKIVVVFGLLFVILEIVTSIIAIFMQPQIILYTIGGMIFPGILIWLSISCLKHPFYGGDGKINLEIFKFWKRQDNSGGGDMTTF